MPLNDQFENLPVRRDMNDVTFRIVDESEFSTCSGSIRAFLDHCDKVRGDKDLLRRADIRPQDLKPYLTMMVILELSYGPDGEVVDLVPRLMGSEIEHFYGKSTGISLKESPNQEAVRRIFRCIRELVRLRKPLATIASGQLTERHRMTVESAYVPIADDGVTINKAVVFVDIR